MVIKSSELSPQQRYDTREQEVQVDSIPKSQNISNTLSSVAHIEFSNIKETDPNEAVFFIGKKNLSPGPIDFESQEDDEFDTSLLSVGSVIQDVHDVKHSTMKFQK